MNNKKAIKLAKEIKSNLSYVPSCNLTNEDSELITNAYNIADDLLELLEGKSND